MAKQNPLVKDGKITEVLPNSRFRVKFSNSLQTAIAYPKGNLRKKSTKILAGTDVKLEYHPTNLEQARIIHFYPKVRHESKVLH